MPIMPSILQKDEELKKALKAFSLLSGLSESELETLEILADKTQRETITAGLQESKKDKVHPLRSIL